MGSLKRVHEWCNKHEWLIALVGIVILLRIPTLVTPHYYGDEEIYFVMGRAWREGIPMYEAMFDHKPPLLYILAGVAQNVFWFRMMLLVAMAIHTILFAQVARKIFGKSKEMLAFVGTAIFVVLTTLPTFEGNIANAELFMMLPITASLLMIMPNFPKMEEGKTTYKEYSIRRYFAAGLLAGIGWLFKVPVAADVAAIALYIFLFEGKKWKDSWKGLINPRLWVYTIGFAIPLASTFVYYYLKGNGPAYLATVVTVNLGYVSSWSTSKFAFNPFASGLVTRGMIVAAFTVFIYLTRSKIDRRVQFLSMWLVFSFFGSMLSGRPYPHYLQQPFLPLSLLLPFIFVVENWLAWLLIGLIALWGVFANRQVGFWAYDTWPIYTSFWQMVTGKISKQDYVYSFDGARRNYTIADYLNERLEPQDKIYVWGSDAAIYNLTNRLPSGGKYIVNFHVHDFHAEPQVMSQLAINKPRFVIVLPNTTEFPALYSMISREYIQTLEVDGAKVYMRLMNSDVIK